MRTPSTVAMKAILWPGRKERRSRTDFGMVIWGFDERVAVAVIDVVSSKTALIWRGSHHRASSFKPARMKAAVSAAGPSSPRHFEIAEAACARA